MIPWTDPAGFLLWRFDVHRIPVRREPPRDARTGPQKPFCASPRGHADHHPLGDDRLIESLALAIVVRLCRLVLRRLPQRQLAQRRQVSLPEEVVQRLLDLLDVVDLPLPQPRAQRVDRDVNVDDLVRTPEKRVGNGLANGDTGDPSDRVVQRFDVLHVHGGRHRDPAVEQFEHVFEALFVRRTRRVRVGELVDDHDIRPARDDRVDVHLLERHAAILDLSEWHALEVADKRFGFGTPVSNHDADDDVDALRLQLVRLFEHLVRLPDTGGGADVHAQPCPLALLDLCEERFRRWPAMYARCHICVICVICGLSHRRAQG